MRPRLRRKPFLLLIDHQSGLFQLVRDIDQPTLRHHVCTLAKLFRLAKIPTFTTTSVPDGPNGPLIPEIHQESVPTSASPVPPWASCAEVPACFDKNSVQSLVGPRTRPISQNAKKGRRARINTTTRARSS